MKSSIKDFFSKCEQIRSFPWIWSHLLKKSLMENFIFCAVGITLNLELDDSCWIRKYLTLLQTTLTSGFSHTKHNPTKGNRTY